MVDAYFCQGFDMAQGKIAPLRGNVKAKEADILRVSPWSYLTASFRTRTDPSSVSFSPHRAASYGLQSIFWSGFIPSSFYSWIAWLNIWGFCTNYYLD
jgi:hypothetical protein